MMYINVLQIDAKDHPDLAFLDYSSAVVRGGVDLDNYELVWEGEVEADNLEDVFRIFNVDPPEGFLGRSMSVSDVVLVDDKDRDPDGWTYYYCDPVGFRLFVPINKLNGGGGK